ncbi:MAG: M48 family metallopeptidase [Gemmatales bacterium]|nr:M48 family metallopeptidase [Gemmatales bacterium]MDW8388261.1 M48 family metallopeptidase [Gemmatales bacterium]
MQFLLMLVICLAFLPVTPAAPFFHPLWTAVATWSGVLLLSLSTLLWSRYFVRRIHDRPDSRAATLRLYTRVRLFHTLACVGWYVASLFLLGWGTVVRETWELGDVILLDELLILAPFLLGICLEWLGFYDTEKALFETSTRYSGQTFWGRMAYLGYHIRFYLGLVLAPILIFTGIHETMIALMPEASGQPWFLLASAGLLLFIILILTPWLLKVLWNARSLPPGPLRHRLEAAARRLGFTYTDILLWNTRGGVANAMVTGVFRFPRYVLLSDGLVNGLEPEEIEAVFGHEVGHVKHHHMALYLGFMMLSLMVISLTAQLILPPLPENEADYLGLLGDWAKSGEIWLASVGGLLFLGGYIWLVFGLLSRRCERQADIYGCKSVSCGQPDCTGHDGLILGDAPRSLPLCPTGIRTFIRALERVADLNGIQRDKPSWRHSSIARRVAFLESLLWQPALEPQFQRRLFLTKLGLVTALSVAVVVLVVLTS